ncbi:MAG TPA: flagellar hook-basal body complex protein, partial [Deltaproteobacteria bacterium]|nr:flagellar hook-basal body complex protein [Deltaproteobacteria bacterium]
MSISSSLFSGISGLSTHGNAMSVIGDNIANVNTIGFKSSRTTFQDVLAQSVATSAGTAQIGRGAALSAIDTLFQQGSFESTSNATDLAIGGNGFFIVSPRGSETEYYTRAGQFRFDADGYFVNPEGYVVKGWALDENGNDVGTLQDIRL